MGAAELVFLLIILAFILVPILGIVDASTRPESQWRLADQNKIVWIVLQIIGGIIGAVAYFATVRPKLQAAAARNRLPGSE